MRICLICVEIFAWGKYGGFGRSARMIGSELAKRGIEVFAVVPRRPGQRQVEELDGITVLGFPPKSPWLARELYRQCDADLYHSQEPSFGTLLAQDAMPTRKHVITFRDPRSWRDWLIELRHPSVSRLRTLISSLYENNITAAWAARRADAVFCCANSLIPVAQRIYGLDAAPGFLPSPIAIPVRPMRKSPEPTVLFLARLDRRKRPDIFLELAKEYPRVRFLAVGSSQDRRLSDMFLRRYGTLANLEFTGFVDQFHTDKHSRLLEESWILINTSAREGLPTSFLEALAHRCALLSHVNPDGFAERFGVHVGSNDFADGLDRLLEHDAWREKGELGFGHVKTVFGLDKAIDDHVAVYRTLLES